MAAMTSYCSILSISVPYDLITSLLINECALLSSILNSAPGIGIPDYLPLYILPGLSTYPF